MNVCEFERLEEAIIGHLDGARTPAFDMLAGWTSAWRHQAIQGAQWGAAEWLRGWQESCRVAWLGAVVSEFLDTDTVRECVDVEYAAALDLLNSAAAEYDLPAVADPDWSSSPVPHVGRPVRG